MAPIPEGGTIAVTGAAGFIASHCVTEVRPRQPPAPGSPGCSVLCSVFGCPGRAVLFNRMVLCMLWGEHHSF